MTAASVDLKDVSRMFQLGSEEVWALRGVTLSVGAGEFVALIGRSGSGKTTLLNLIGGLDRATAGELLVDGRRVDAFSDAELTKFRRRDIGFIFQSFGLLPLLSAAENVELPLRIAGFGHGDRVKMAREAIELVGLTRRAHHRPYELSGGEQQRVAIARAIATGPRLILADEPTGELDSATAKAVFGLLRELAAERDMTVLTCTHDRMVMEMADRVEELADGRLVAEDERKLWQHVQSVERSPFEAQAPGPSGAVRTEEAPRLAALTGSSPSGFKRTAEPAPWPQPDELDDDDEAQAAEEPEDAGQWARPGPRRE